MRKINDLLLGLNSEFKELEKYIEEKIKTLNKGFNGKSEKLFSEKDTMLITYADQFFSQDQNNLKTLNKFLQNDLKNKFSIVHLLPFYPWTSDDGFSPTDYQKVEETYGDWEDIENIPAKKMYDCVFNHLSSENEIFQKAIAGDVDAQKMFHFVDEQRFNSDSFQEYIPLIVRPRTSPLFTPFEVNGELKYVWTTFSADQVDTNLSNIKMMKYLLETFFFYIEKGAQYFRVDAVPFMWKEFGTNCSHLPKTHQFVQLLRAIADEINTDLYLVTESNVPHEENISYWGNGQNEAHIIYNFSLAPLVLHAIMFKTNEYIHDWTRKVFDISSETTYLNFTASHDGIGMRGLEGIVPEKDVFKLCEIAEEKGGVIGKKVSRDGTVRPYELNITWASMLKEPEEEEDTFVRKVVNSHSIVMFFPGIGAHYVHNLLGSLNWNEGYKESGIPRRLNRKKLSYPLEIDSHTEKIKDGILELIEYKSKKSVFSPTEKIEVYDLDSRCLCFSRGDVHNKIKVMFNLTNTHLVVDEVELKPYELRFIEKD